MLATLTHNLNYQEGYFWQQIPYFQSLLSVEQISLYFPGTRNRLLILEASLEFHSLVLLTLGNPHQSSTGCKPYQNLLCLSAAEIHGFQSCNAGSSDLLARVRHFEIAYHLLKFTKSNM